ncbi:hypothetical protein BGZ75_005653 [Mortierella antarctica]|nr:hypothetical protein BGZ75_005653 [Mortierella antarctica]
MSRRHNYLHISRSRATNPTFVIHFPSHPLPLIHPRHPICRVDVLGTYFLTIRYAYIRHPPHTAQQSIEKEISKLGDKSRLILYVDGHQATEKQATHDARGATRAVAKAEAQKFLAEIEDRVKKDLSVRKWRFDNTDKSIKKSFYWNVHDRASFCRHMEQSGWTVQTAATEADVATAREIEPGDVVISRDSDMLIYGRICTLYRGISRGRFHVHDILGSYGLA